MYHVHATVTEDLSGYVVTVQFATFSGPKRHIVFEETWMIQRPFDERDDAAAALLKGLERRSSEMSEFLRRVASGESQV